MVRRKRPKQIIRFYLFLGTIGSIITLLMAVTSLAADFKSTSLFECFRCCFRYTQSNLSNTNKRTLTIYLKKLIYTFFYLPNFFRTCYLISNHRVHNIYSSWHIVHLFIIGLNVIYNKYEFMLSIYLAHLRALFIIKKLSKLINSKKI